ncbi:MAG: YhgE/Pip domain-containing protein [Pseudobutyrivibrio sp.]|nr:YhgE/Pip domain-containing protein [Pseudobutyrivibrio sp.]
MKNILKIIVSDIKRLSTNVVAVVVIIGLTVIPCLYAWFNILSNWDPYGESATSNLQVAVASSDQGIVLGNFEVNVGDTIISNLKENKTIGWVFTDTAQEAIEGVYAGDYYAALVIDEQFSANMISFLSGDIENPVITYYENEKKNAIAPKITGKVKTTIEREVDHAFVGTIAETFLNASEYLASVDEEGNVTGEGIAKLEQLDSDINGVITILDSYIALMDSTEQISEASQSVTETADSITELAEKMAQNAQQEAKEAKPKVDEAKNDLDNTITNINDKLDILSSNATTIENELNNQTVNISAASTAKEIQDNISSVWGSTEDTLSPNYILTNISTGNSDIDDQLHGIALDINTKISTLNTDIDAWRETEEKGNADVNQFKQTVLTDLSNLQDKVDVVRASYSEYLKPTADAVSSSAEKAVEEIEKLLKYDATSIDLVVSNLDNYSAIMDKSKESLVKSRDEAVEMEQGLSALIADIKGVSENEAYQKFAELIKSDPEFLSDFISSPVDISDEYIYPIENNGSATAPFYIILSIWVGSLIMSTILKTTVKDTTGMVNLKNWQCFFGRYFVTFAIGQIQTIITVLGAFLFVGIQCQNYFLFWLTCAWTSLIYSLLLYSFTYSFGNVGEALSVILMVIQVAGAGGTFPIEVLPKVFQILYKFMPFKYSMNALRECIGGFYKNTYRDCMLTLIAYGVVAIFVGVVLYHPCKVLNEKIESSKEASGILI